MIISIINLQKKVPIQAKEIKKIVLMTLFSEKINKPGEINICFLTDKRMKQLNQRYLGKNHSTDVLAFDISQNKKEIVSDIVISADKAFSNSHVYKTSALYEIYLYVAHGILHILGYDDKTARAKKIMDKKAKGILSALKLNLPGLKSGDSSRAEKAQYHSSYGLKPGDFCEGLNMPQRLI